MCPQRSYPRLAPIMLQASGKVATYSKDGHNSDIDAIYLIKHRQRQEINEITSRQFLKQNPIYSFTFLDHFFIPSMNLLYSNMGLMFYNASLSTKTPWLGFEKIVL